MWTSLTSWLPRGRDLPTHEWERRHRFAASDGMTDALADQLSAAASGLLGLASGPPGSSTTAPSPRPSSGPPVATSS